MPVTVIVGDSVAGFHGFRHGVATTLIDRAASITTVGAQLRHSDPNGFLVRADAIKDLGHSST
jgi:integrase